MSKDEAQAASDTMFLVAGWLTAENDPAIREFAIQEARALIWHATILQLHFGITPSFTAQPGTP